MLKNRTKSAIIWSVMLAITLLVGACSFLITCAQQQSIKADAAVSNQEVIVSSSVSSLSENSVQEQLPENHLKLLGVGDNLIHTAIYSQANRRAGGNGYDFDYQYSAVADIVYNADIASINQETVMASIYEPSSYPMFNSPTQLGDAMIKLGFDVFNIANNHVIDKGEKGMQSYFEYWDSHHEIAVTGVYRNEDDYNNIRLVNRDGIILSFIGMTEFTNGLSFPENSDIVLLKTSQREKIKERIGRAKQISDIVIINVHWGVEYSNTPTNLQRSLAKDMINWGADVILGHHPHVIQPVEYIERIDGSKGVVCYSLGNFISAQSEAPRMIGGMLSVEFDITDKLNPFIAKAEFIPIVTHYERGYNNVRIIPFADYSDKLALAHGIREENSEFSYQYIRNYIKNVIDDEFLQLL